MTLAVSLLQMFCFYMHTYTHTRTITAAPTHPQRAIRVPTIMSAGTSKLSPKAWRKHGGGGGSEGGREPEKMEARRPVTITLGDTSSQMTPAEQ